MYFDGSSGRLEPREAHSRTARGGGGFSPTDADLAAADRARLAAIAAALGGGYELLADVSMGETAGIVVGGPVAAAGGVGKANTPAAASPPSSPGRASKVEWYGFVRLLVLVRRESALGAKLAADRGRVRTMVVPRGEKPTGAPGARPYPPGCSPDKVSNTHTMLTHVASQPMPPAYRLLVCLRVLGCHFFFSFVLAQPTLPPVRSRTRVQHLCILPIARCGWVSFSGAPSNSTTSFTSFLISSSSFSSSRLPPPSSSPTPTTPRVAS